MSGGKFAVRLRIFGRVQGVGYRHWTHLRALHAGLTGFVRNRSDGSVEAVFVGAKTEVEDMVARCRIGPRGAHVTEIQVDPWQDEGFQSFDVRPTE